MDLFKHVEILNILPKQIAAKKPRKDISNCQTGSTDEQNHRHLTTVTQPIVPVKAATGEYEIDGIVRQERIRIGGKWQDVCVVKWKNTISLNSDIKNVHPAKLAQVPYGLLPEDYNLLWSSNLEVDPNKYYCQYCSQTFTCQGNGVRHEKKRCRFPGAPNHRCSDTCDEQCPGQGVWRLAHDGRAGRKMPSRKKV